MYRSGGSSCSGAPRTLAIGWAVLWTSARVIGLPLSVVQAHHLAHLPHRLAGDLARLVAAVGDEVADERGIVEVLLRPFAHRALLGQHFVDDRLLALETADAGATAPLLHPGLGWRVRVDEVELPHRAFVRIAWIGALHPRGVGRHGAD